jgi:hypothetical protein
MNIIIAETGIDFFEAREQILTILKNNAIELTKIYGNDKNLKIEINTNSKTGNCNINLQESNL